MGIKLKYGCNAGGYMMNKKMVARVIFLILVIGTLITIFAFSSQGGIQSKSVSRTVMREIVDINPKTKYLSDVEKERIVEESQPFIRKTAHFTIYMVLGMMVMGFCSTYDLNWKKKLIITILCGLIYAVSDEIHQGFTGDGRTPKVFDVCVDTLGTLTGAFIMLGGIRFVKYGLNSKILKFSNK